MKKYTEILIATGLCLIIIISAAGLIFAANSKNQPDNNSTSPQITLQESSAEITAEDVASTDIKKNETVYVFADASGSVNKILVSDFLQNISYAKKLADKTELSSIENVKGDEEYYHNGSDLIWNADGNDIYYQGESKKDLPVKLKITYHLNDLEVSAKDLAGKSGKVKIKFEFINQTVAYKEGSIPFAAISGILLDNDCFRNINVENAKAINDGDRTVVAAVCFPGLNKSLNAGDINLPEYFEISADVNDFRLGTTFSIVSNSVFSSEEPTDGKTAISKEIDDIAGKISTLVSGMNQLYNGSEELLSGADRIVSGVDQLTDGLDQLKDNTPAILNGAKEVFLQLLETATEQIQKNGASIPELTMDNFDQVIDDTIAKYSREGLTQTVSQFTLNENSVLTKTIVDIASKKVGDGMEELKKLKTKLDGYREFYQGLIKYCNGVVSAADGADTLNSAMPEFLDGIKQLRDGVKLAVDGLGSSGAGKIGNISKNLKLLLKASSDYKNYSGIADGMDGEVKFIYRTEEIKAE